MKKFIAIVTMLLAFTAVPAYSQMDASAPAPAATEAAGQKQCCPSLFCRMTEFFKTIGKSGEEKEKIIAECRAKCTAKQGEKAAS